MMTVKELCYFVPSDTGEKRILKDISFETRGRHLAIIGRNGSGKSSLVRILGGLVRASSGFVQFDGSEPRTSPAYLPQRAEDGLWLELTVRESLVVATSRGRLSRAGSHSWMTTRRVIPWLPALLEERLDARVGTLSGGERQILLLASALAGAYTVEAKNMLLLADEFTASLDPAHERQAHEALGQAIATSLVGGHLIIVTHSLTEIRLFASDVVALQEGNVLWCRRASDVTPGIFLDVYEGSSGDPLKKDGRA